MKNYNLIGAGQAVTGLLITLVHFVFPACADMVKTAAGTTVPMKCHWTEQAVIATGAMILIVGLLRFVFGRNAETRGTLDTATVALGAGVILFTTVLIGTCADPAHACNVGMKPANLLLGAVTMILGGVGLFNVWRGSRRAPLAAG